MRLSCNISSRQEKLYSGRLTLLQAALVVVFVGFIVLAVSKDELFEFGHYALPEANLLLKLLLSITICLGLVAAGGMIWRLCLWRRYEPWQMPACCDWPNVSVIVPVYNESQNIVKTIKSVMNSDYPREKLQVIVVNDGSDDDSGWWIRGCVEKYAGHILSLALKTNCGKRAALLRGFRHAGGQILVTLDSDCTIGKNSLKQLVSPLLCDHRVGAVAGNICVLNHDCSLIGKMLSVSFAMAFGFNRAIQSTLGRVFCTPGAFSAYRLDAVRAVLDVWSNQSFCGRPARIAEDRALTNLLLRSGWDVVYQDSAVARTLVPRSIKGLCKMYLRWARGDVRESIIYGTTVFRRRKGRTSCKADINFLLTVVNIVTPYLLLMWTLIWTMQSPEVLLHTIAWTILGGGLAMGWYAWYYRTWDFLYGLLYIFFWSVFCAWIMPWAVLTVFNNRWITRENAKLSET